MIKREAPADPRVTRLIEKSRELAWDLESDIDWTLEVDKDAAGLAPETSLLRGFPEYEALDEKVRRRLAFSEACYQLSNLLAGEKCGDLLTEQVLQLTEEHRKEDREYLQIVNLEEKKHAKALERYLTQKVGELYGPDPILGAALGELEAHPRPEIKLLVGQVIFEWTAASLSANLLMKSTEPLVQSVLRLNLRDEARHLQYSHLVLEPLKRLFASASNTKGLEDLVYRGMLGSLSSLLAAPAWEAAGLVPSKASWYAIDAIEESGVVDRYARLLVGQIARTGFPTDRLERRLKSGRLRTDLFDSTA